MVSNKKAVLIAGSGGLLGTRLFNYFESQGFEVGAIYRTNRNFQAKNSYKIDLVNSKTALNTISDYDILINCAGLTDVDQNQKLPEKSWLENVVTATNLAEFAKKREMHFIHISTDHFQSAKSIPRSESDQMFASNNYSYAKLQAEKQVLRVYPTATVIRTNFFGSGNPRGNSLFDWVIAQIKSNQKIIGFDNVIFNPVSIDFLCKAIVTLSKLPSQGIINVSGPHELTKFELQVEIRKVIKEQKATAVFVTHSIAEATFMADRIVIMSKLGKIVFDENIDLPENRKKDLRQSQDYFKTLNRIQNDFEKLIGGTI